MIGYYAHQHGSGHCRFADLFSRNFEQKVNIFTSVDYNFHKRDNLWLLEDENPDGTAYPQNQVQPPDYLHYSPVGQQSIQKRSLQLLETIVKEKIELLIVDVSAEIAALARASSIAYAYVKLPGNRNDSAHLQAFQGAVFVLAYYPKEFEDPCTPQWLVEKTIYLGFLTSSNFSNIERHSQSISDIAVISGMGGNENLETHLPYLVNRFPNARFHLCGNFNTAFDHPKVIRHGYVTNLDRKLQECDLIIANCGLNTVSELLQIPKPFLVIPEDRPFGEQEFMASVLVNKKLALDMEMVIDFTDAEILQFSKPIRENHTKSILKQLESMLLKHRTSLPNIPKLFHNIKINESYEYN